MFKSIISTKNTEIAAIVHKFIVFLMTISLKASVNLTVISFPLPGYLSVCKSAFQ